MENRRARGLGSEAEKLRFEMARLAPRDRYKLLSGIVIPRPIAWVTTVGAEGGVNAAPFSYLSVMRASCCVKGRSGRYLRTGSGKWE